MRTRASPDVQDTIADPSREVEALGWTTEALVTDLLNAGCLQSMNDPGAVKFSTSIPLSLSDRMHDTRGACGVCKDGNKKCTKNRETHPRLMTDALAIHIQIKILPDRVHQQVLPAG